MENNIPDNWRELIPSLESIKNVMEGIGTNASIVELPSPEKRTDCYPWFTKGILVKGRTLVFECDLIYRCFTLHDDDYYEMWGICSFETLEKGTDWIANRIVELTDCRYDNEEPWNPMDTDALGSAFYGLLKDNLDRCSQ
tara:strand:- start:5761 stop:6180 length:420 start_codon:yes stop_codon:yes gene_type:complete